MKQTLSVGMTAATFLMTAALAAQAPPPQQPNTTPQQPPSQPQQRSESAAGKITVSGCIAKAEQPGTQGFVLTNATTGAASSTSGGGAVGTTGAGAPSASTSASAALTYRLDADDEKLTPHVGHRVEIVGTSAPMADSSAARSAEPGRPAAPSLKVESIKMVAQTCAAK
jgi:hypothetical protein